MSFAMVGDLLESLGDMNLFITLDMTKSYQNLDILVFGLARKM